jgi:hypothetical protein
LHHVDKFANLSSWQGGIKMVQKEETEIGSLAGEKGANKPPKHRSPAYPFISLGKALERAREFYTAQRQHAAPIVVAAQCWKFAVKSSGGLQTAAALKQYGLMKEAENTPTRQVLLTDLALRIIRDERESSLERGKAIQMAALMPKIHNELWAKWGSELPAEATVKYFLVQEKGYYEGSTDDLIKTYKDTIVFAKLSDSDKDSHADGEQVGELENHAQNHNDFLPPSTGARLMEGERVVFTQEIEPEHGIRIVASGAVDADLIDAVEMFLKLHKRRLGIQDKTEK